MGKCLFCNVEMSDKVLRIHQLQCKELKKDIKPKKEKKLTDTEIRQMAKEKELKSWHLKAISTLKEELEL